MCISYVICKVSLSAPHVTDLNSNITLMYRYVVSSHGRMLKSVAIVLYLSSTPSDFKHLVMNVKDVRLGVCTCTCAPMCFPAKIAYASK